MSNEKKTLKYYCDQIVADSKWLERYQSFVPRFINESITKVNYKDWEKEVFEEFFETSTDQCVASLKQGWFTIVERENIKNSWSEIAPLLKGIAESQEIPQWELYDQLINKIRTYTSKNRIAATHRLIVSLQPQLMTTIISYDMMHELIHLIEEHTTEKIQKYKKDDILKQSYQLNKLFNHALQPDNPMDIKTLPWHLYQHLKNIKPTTINMNKYLDEKITLLEKVYNIIFTGAPGTGKTYLAKKMAEKMGAEWQFIQFHPSYDYSDFVEGLRPTEPDENGAIGFELKDGVFKSFCKKAMTKKTNNFDEIYEQFIEDVSQNPLVLETPTYKRKFNVQIGKKKGCSAVPQTETATEMSITKQMLRNYIEKGDIRDWKPYTTAIGEYIKSKYKIYTKDIAIGKKFVFIIDEINRGEMSRIFGELFFSLDPSYRGSNGSVYTQYSNMHSEEEDAFYIPENVYIIGTMNNIDRSVESFDFAMRRRFTWVEISAEESAQNMNLPKDAINRVNSLNEKIKEIPGLGESYQIGAAYFLDNKGNARNDYDDIWKYRLKPLLKEYLRGMSDSQDLLNQLKAAYYAETND